MKLESGHRNSKFTIDMSLVDMLIHIGLMTPQEKELDVYSVVFIFYDRGSNKFLLEKRPLDNPTLGGETVFPGEKGGGSNNLLSVARGIREEMGEVKATDISSIQPFSGDVGNLGKGTIQAFVIAGWEGEIKEVEPEKGKHVWVDREEVMGRLTYDASRHLFWMALCNLKLIKASDFNFAPKMEIPTEG